MPETVTLTVPESVLHPLRRTAAAINQPVEELLLMALQNALPPLDGLLEDVRQNLTELELLDDEWLWRVMLETVPSDEQQQLEQLLLRQQAEQLDEATARQLAGLQQRADLVMLRKARAAVLLRLRGRRVPTLAELNQLTKAASSA